MHDPISVKVHEALKKLIQDGLDGSRWYRLPLGLVVVVDDLKQVVLRILEYDKDTFLFQDYLGCMYNVGM